MVASLRIFNPDGSEAELSGNGVREAVMYLRRSGWTDSDSFSIQTAAGEVRPHITGPATCTVDMGRAALSSDSYPRAARDGTGTLEAGGRELAFQFVSIGNPQCAIEWGEDLEELDLSRSGRADRTPRAVPQPHQRLLLAPDRRRRDPRPDLRARGGGDDVVRNRGHRRRRGRRAARRGQPGDREAGRRRPEVDVGEDLHVDLTGWAVPVYAGELSDEFVES